MNIYDVSEKAGVSIATVSRVINGNSNVSEKTRLKVLAVMEEIGYTPNVFARGLGLNTMKTIGIMCTDSSDIYLANAVYYLERELRNNGYDSILCCTGPNLATKKKYLDLLMSKRVDAIILVGSKYLEQKAAENNYIINAAKELPIMLVNGHLDGPNIYSTLCDDEDAVFNVTDSLIRSGRTDIVYLYTSTSYSGLRKMAGYKRAHFVHNITPQPHFIKLCDKNIQCAKDSLLDLYSMGSKFQAVVTSDDSLAVGAIKFALSKGISIPDDLSIVGYNNSLLSLACEPELTSIDSKVEALCITTINTLMGVFNGSNVPSKTNISADLIKRGTTNF
ncbi:LacI family transcriptional regulator [Falcatimonas sp. MSJ-15]|uniref:LacI family DNA-binding transcriptional regulator n=1 Tax=Falcatimonas sp. MSJ-15 TaxID=2841515 RepID=UPI001C11F346|nr:LacI family DNA-binding transcriptional regulator [Falcatimonas sp. MSJ-15]MBU5470420.1 LacI family transcriptional regulator [Falcatimonas sp. MSJ-15]